MSFYDFCEKCKKEIKAEERTDLNRIEGHHVHPCFMNNPKGIGKVIYLCRNCHINKLHPLLFKIIKKHSNLLSNRNKSWDWVFKYHILPNKKEECIKEVIDFTNKWVKEHDTN